MRCFPRITAKTHTHPQEHINHNKNKNQNNQTKYKQTTKPTTTKKTTLKLDKKIPTPYLSVLLLPAQDYCIPFGKYLINLDS